MRSLGFSVSMMLILSLFSVQAVLSSPSSYLSTPDLITVLSGEILSRSINVINDASINFMAVVYTGYHVEGLPTSLVNFTPSYTVFKNWKAGESQTMPFNISVSSRAVPGIYTLVLEFRGMAEDGSLHTLSLKVPLRISRNPIILKSVRLYVLERPDAPSPDPFNGETLVVRAVVENIGPHPEGFLEWINVTSLKSDGVVYSTSGSSAMSPGEAEIEDRIPIRWNWKPGEYNVSIFIESLRGNGSFWRVIRVSPGVDYMNVSLSRDVVMKGEDLKAYLTVLSERTLDVNLSVSVFLNTTALWKKKFSVLLKPGVQVLEINLPTNDTGSLLFVAKLLHGNYTLVTGQIDYRVLGYPFFALVKSSLKGDVLVLNVSLINPNRIPFWARLLYNISIENVLLYSDSEQIVLNPGENRKSFGFRVPGNATVLYSFILSGDGKTFDTSSGSIEIPPVPTTTSSTIPSNTSFPSGEKKEGSREYLLVGILILIVLIVALGFLMGSLGEEGYISPWERARKPRVKRKPKRRSPLGRFKRPKLPKFIENRELPRRFRRRPLVKTRKKH